MGFRKNVLQFYFCKTFFGKSSSPLTIFLLLPGNFPPATSSVLHLLFYQIFVRHLPNSSTKTKSDSSKETMAEPYIEQVEYLDVLTKTGKKTGVSKPRGDVHRDGDYHKAVHVWIFAESTQELLLQKRADYKDSWPGLWDISSAGHISAGDSSLITAQRELQEELGVILPKDAFELIFIFLEECVTNNGKFINNEYSDVYRVTTLEPISREAFTLQVRKLIIILS
ncbi:hypothetical protein ES332_D12G217200v1 [Gossypium tomentosum]|uniref:Nudix hydrolase domain-containing protein n=1 Tax=Gossypium tomentosum TaxID=34277 RepID=A0A5D2ICA8_GOSTO|nr:hypothetical protein ES332_D12G217200v1 [Gossypium tomentosum]